jgi:hypothetical protein
MDANFEKLGTWVNQPSKALARGEPSLAVLTLDIGRSATFRNLSFVGTKLMNQLLHLAPARLEQRRVE